MLNKKFKLNLGDYNLRYLSHLRDTGKYASSSLVVNFVALTGFLGGLTFIFEKNRQNLHKDQSETQKRFINEIKPKLENSGPTYIDAPNIQNLISLPRFEQALMRIKYANKDKTRQNYETVIDELLKLSLDKDSFIKSNDNDHRFLSDGLTNYVAQFLDEQFQLGLAFRAPQVDHRFFRSEPPSTVEKLIRTVPNCLNNNQDPNEPINIFEQVDYGLIFEFLNKIIPKIRNGSMGSDKNIAGLVGRFESDVNSYVLSEYSIPDRPNLNIWSADGLDVNLEYLEEEKAKDSFNNLKQKLKLEFIRRNDLAIVKILEKIVQLSKEEFISIDGLETLILLFEKYKYDEEFLKSIGNCLCLISEDIQYRKLFVQSGWLRRINQMCKKDFYTSDKKSDFNEHDNIDLIAELIAHKLLFNLNRNPEIDEPVVYSTMVYPLYPMYEDSLRQKKHLLQKEVDDTHEHIVDVVFIHGLRGSLFKTWRQNDDIKLDLIPNQNRTLNDIENKILNKLNSLIEGTENKFSYCWPKDWLSVDTKQSDQLDQIDMIRLLGINYDSMYSLWYEEEFDEKKLKNGIRERAIDLVGQLKKANLGQRSIVWVCHSMGGLIVKQMLVYLNELGGNEIDLVNKTKAIVFMSTPHLGSSIAKTVSSLSFALYPTADVLDLSLNSPYLAELNEKFLKLAKGETNATKSNEIKYKILTFCENLQTYIGYKLSITTVSKESADIGIGEFYLMDDRDHYNISKPDNRDYFMYQKILEFVNQEIKHECESCVKCKEIKARKLFNSNDFFKSTMSQMFYNF